MSKPGGGNELEDSEAPLFASYDALPLDRPASFLVRPRIATLSDKYRQHGVSSASGIEMTSLLGIR